MKKMNMVLAVALLWFQCFVVLPSSLEQAAFLDLRSTLGIRGQEWPLKANPCSSWKGVQCRSGRVFALTVSGLRRTKLGRRNPGFSVDSLANFSELAFFNASGFGLSGPIPEWFGQKLAALEVLDLSSASVMGEIPKSLSNLTKLHRLDLSSNFLSGRIPSSFGNLSRLKFLKLFNNSLRDSIPTQLGELSQLLELDLSKNSISGSLPVELRGLRSLRKMEIGDNGLEGLLPEGLFLNLTHLEVLVVSGNRISGSVPAALGSIPSLRFVDLSRNQFTGVLPRLSANGSAFFNLSMNSLYGNLLNLTYPVKTVRVIADLSNNYLEGGVLDIWKKNFDLHNNCLQIDHQRSFNSCRKFYESKGLSFNDFVVLAPLPSPIKAEKEGKHRVILVVVSVFSPIIVVIVAVTLTACLFGNQNEVEATENAGQGAESLGAANPNGVETVVHVGDDSLGDQVTFEEICQITDNFNVSRFMHHGYSGDFYRGSCRLGTVIVKKVNLDLLVSHFEVEMEVYHKVTHSRFVPLLGKSTENGYYVIYKAAEHRDLASFLVSGSISWTERLKAGVGVAEVLCYLHSFDPPLVHSDVQATSILIDGNIEAQLGSLSSVHAEEEHKQIVSSTFFQKPQSSEQSPALLSSTRSDDVYCFGKVLLELLMGWPCISNECAPPDLLDHFMKCKKEKFSEMLSAADKIIWEDLWTFAIVAKVCLDPQPCRRPPMSCVLEALKNPQRVVKESAKWRPTFSCSWRNNASECHCSWHY